ncbi:penicillin acylase family protein [Plastoroseomonas hellenica]|uniref:penicillin acylase family protein n=1 Tax=Plastoroseomonas hellenica TaxID=2687306 RepID=UPI001BA5EC49|nr:penicillin acylase family protein [Plastoroseomonas hellenica]MBR0643012.1 penicillin acylase family protein [Plastoroseomonas hellenica]
MSPAFSAEALRAAVPPVSGERHLPGLGASVTVLRDRWGIPHIRAEGSSTDAFRAQGFVHAQDRLFQMELNRRRALGRAAEWLGPAAAEGDVLARRLGVEAASRRDCAALGDDACAMVDAYVAGVNAFIASGGPRPVEYGLLGAEPEPWEGWHCIAVMRRLGLLMGSVWFKLWRAAALPLVGAENAAKLRYDDSGRDLLLVPPGVEAERWTAMLADLAPGMDALLGAADGDATGGGSNNWAVAPARSATKRPVLAGDPHRVFEIPNMYAQGHLACDAFDAIGLTVPGVPGFPHFAHNGRVAWCVTHAFVDIHDLFVERLDATGTRCAFRDEWRPVRRREEEVAIRGEAPRRVEVLETDHGPIIAQGEGGIALALRSVQFAETDLSFDCLPRMLRAESVAALFEATRGWGLIDHNLVAGDTKGSVGHLVRARVPRRPRSNGWLPVPGWTGAHEWQGWIPHEEMPCVIDPPEGLIVTANNRVAADGGPDYLCTDCHPPYRARRILDRLRSEPEARSVDGAAALHGDTLSANALLFQERLAALPEPADAAAASLRARLLTWDGRMQAGSEAATAYVAFRRALTALLAERSGLGELAGHPFLTVAPGVVPQNQLWWALPTLLRADDTALLGGLPWAEAMQEALSRAAQQDTARAWGKAHRPRFVHPLSASFPDAAPLLDPAGRAIGGDTDTVLANGLLPASGPAATYGALARYVFDVGDWENSRWIVFHGASGHPGSAHYTDQHPDWAEARMVPMTYAWDILAGAAEAQQILRP